MKTISDFFQNYKIDYCKLKEYGFIETNNKYVFSKQINNLIFKIRIENRNISLEIFDNDFNDECINYEITSIKEKWLEIINDIKNKCFIYTKYDNDQAMIIDQYILKKYNVEAEFMFDKFPNFGVYKNNKKWFCIIMDIDYSKIDKNKNGLIYILNIKSNNVDELLPNRGFYPSYHMNKKNWITIVLDNNIDVNYIKSLIDISYELVKKIMQKKYTF